MRRGWEVCYSDGTIITEEERNWKDIPKVNIQRLTLHFDGRRWDIVDKNGYMQKKRGSIVPGFNDSFSVEARSIGYYEGNKKIWYTVNESTGKMTMEVMD